MVNRKLTDVLKKRLGDGKAIVIMGARQVGKTTLLKSMFKSDNSAMFLNGDEPDVQSTFENATSTALKQIFVNKKYIVIDEAQRIKNIGLKLKLVTDSIPNVKLFICGSSSLDLANKINEPLTGRKWEYMMYPLSFDEMAKHHGLLEEKRLIPHRLVYGYYPEVVTSAGDEKEILKQLSDSYLYKDILMWEQVKKPEKLVKLLQALAYQIGSQVSYAELSGLCGLDAKTIERYISLLEQCYVIFRLSSFSRNLRNELKFSKKIYFYDNGIRNSLIANYSAAQSRQDIGNLWENFLVSERKKRNSYGEHWCNSWFWRTTEQKEIDYIEEADGKISAFEFKWNDNAKYKTPAQFADAYPNAALKIISPGNAEEFML
ncbi:MAG: ATP-binding protein [Chitinispirillia bacterium]|nr:ATP-binding protein [Chitinispirillia bacterium]MCL2241851.1 ATP-binding protein [Chitinispirillia bacterium]